MFYTMEREKKLAVKGSELLELVTVYCEFHAITYHVTHPRPTEETYIIHMMVGDKAADALILYFSQGYDIDWIEEENESTT